MKSKTKVIDHRRKIEFITKRISQESVEIVGTLSDVRRRKFLCFSRTDLIHLMKVRVKVDSAFKIVDASFETKNAPYLECMSPTVPAARIVGLSLEKGFSRQVSDLYGGTSGCSHILTILMNLAQAARQGVVFTLRFPEEERLMTDKTLLKTVQTMASQIKDTCQVWSVNSKVQSDLQKGEVRDLPARLYPNFKSKK